MPRHFGQSEPQCTLFSVGRIPNSQRILKFVRVSFVKEAGLFYLTSRVLPHKKVLILTKITVNITCSYAYFGMQSHFPEF